VGVSVAVGIAAPVDDHRVIKQGVAVRVFPLAEFVKERGELSDVPLIDVGDFFNPVGAILMVREVVVALDDADLVKRPVAAIMGKHQGRDSR
jgi:hypothetical protein